MMRWAEDKLAFSCSSRGASITVAVSLNFLWLCCYCTTHFPPHANVIRKQCDAEREAPWPNEFVAFLKGQEFQWQWWDPQVVLGPGPHPCLGAPPLPNPLLHTSALGSTQGGYRVLTVCSLHQGWPLLSPLWAAKQDGPLRAPCPEAALW